MAQQTKNSLTTKERSVEGEKLLKSAKEQSSFENDLTQTYAATKTDEVVLLVGVQQADGSVSIRHTIYGEETNSNIQNQPLAFIVSNKLLTISINKINNLVYLDYSHSIVAGGLLEMS